MEIYLQRKFKGRPIKSEVYDEDGYRIHTTQGEDDPRFVQTEGSSTLIFTP